MNDTPKSRENIVYSATSIRSGIGDLVTGMELTREDIWRSIRECLEVVPWATKDQLQRWVRGYSRKRYSTIEKVLKSKEKSKDLRVEHYGKNKVYARPIRTKGRVPYLYHGISVTELYLKIMMCKEGVGIPSGDFKGYGVIPDFGVEYLNSVLLGEMETSNDTHYHKRLEGKVRTYNDNMYRLEDAYKIPIVVLFVLDVKRELVKKRVEDLEPGPEMYFTDYKTFKENTPNDPIFFWKDGKEYPLIR